MTLVIWVRLPIKGIQVTVIESYWIVFLGDVFHLFTLYHGKLPFFTTIWEHMLVWNFFQPPKNKQIEVIRLQFLKSFG